MPFGQASTPNPHAVYLRWLDCRCPIDQSGNQIIVAASHSRKATGLVADYSASENASCHRAEITVLGKPGRPSCASITPEVHSW
jgi:hypothetical protein